MIITSQMFLEVGWMRDPRPGGNLDPLHARSHAVMEQTFN